MEYKLDDADIEKEAQNTELKPVEEAEEPESPEDEASEQEDEDIKERLAKAEKAFEDQKLRARKAEKQLEKLQGSKDKTRVESKGSLSYMDMLALNNANVSHEEDVREVLDYATFKNISVSEALKSSVVKASLSEKEELRNTANATNTGKSRSGSAKMTGESLLDKANKTGELPESEEDLNELIAARYKKK